MIDIDLLNAALDVIESMYHDREYDAAYVTAGMASVAALKMSDEAPTFEEQGNLKDVARHFALIALDCKRLMIAAERGTLHIVKSDDGDREGVK